MAQFSGIPSSVGPAETAALLKIIEGFRPGARVNMTHGTSRAAIEGGESLRAQARAIGDNKNNVYQELFVNGWTPTTL